MYLKLYNLLSLLGWSSVFYVYAFTEALPDAVLVLLIIVQSMAVLEPVHALLGVVRSSLLITAAQVASRMLLAWHFIPITMLSVDNGLGLGHHLVLTAWSLTEIVRSAHYLGLPGTTWLRYSTFLPLYPLGVLGELIIVDGTDFTYKRALYGVYAVTFPFLYVHMIKLRRKKLD